MGGSREILIRRRRTLAQLNNCAAAVARRMITLDPSSTFADPRTLRGCGDPRTLFLKRVRGGPFFEKINTGMVRGATERRP